MTKYRQLHLVPTREKWTKDDDERTPICLNPYPFIKIATEIKVQYPQLKVLTVHVQSDWDIFLETTTGVREGFMENTAVYGPWSATFIGVGRLEILGADMMRTIFQNDAIVSTWIWICQCAPELLEEIRTCPNLEQEHLDAKERVGEELNGIPALEAYFSPSTSHNVPRSMVADYWARMAHCHPEYAGCGLDSFELWSFILQLWPDEDD
ncbi:hypothetical protein B0A48_17852 [Cryoendolithus antarcticus]|uniref:Uncharacterized protein n=1 Tax=Cryoendolithus antarcticus TaxID=1507870 RepID=A0A1V8SA96_9PEZI|nr:hypothetical protein B0A48_17852 [Cryoendolithus antarcticus]